MWQLYNYFDSPQPCQMKKKKKKNRKHEMGHIHAMK
jgi:hypothetical protein